MPGIKDISMGGAGGNGQGSCGRVPIQDPPRTRPFPWPFPYSASQGCVGGAGGVGKAQIPIPPYDGPFQYYWPYGVPQTWGLPTNSVHL